MKPIFWPLCFATISLAVEIGLLAQSAALQPRGCGASCMRQESGRTPSPSPPVSRASSSSSANSARRVNTRPVSGSTGSETVRGGPRSSDIGPASDVFSPVGRTSSPQREGDNSRRFNTDTALDAFSPARSRSRNSNPDLNNSMERQQSSGSSSGAPSSELSWRTMSSSSSISTARKAISPTRRQSPVASGDDAARAQETIDRQNHPADIQATIKGPVWVWSQKGYLDSKRKKRVVKAGEEIDKHWSSQRNVYKQAQVGKGGSIMVSGKGRSAGMSIHPKKPSHERFPTVQAWTPEIGGFTNRGERYVRVRVASDSATSPAAVVGGLDRKGKITFQADNSQHTKPLSNQPKPGMGWFPPNWPGRPIG